MNNKQYLTMMMAAYTKNSLIGDIELFLLFKLLWSRGQ